jgi:hypothetical protein
VEHEDVKESRCRNHHSIRVVVVGGIDHAFSRLSNQTRRYHIRAIWRLGSARNLQTVEIFDLSKYRGLKMAGGNLLSMG